MRLFTYDGVHTLQLDEEDAVKFKKRYGQAFKEVRRSVRVSKAKVPESARGLGTEDGK